MTQKKNIGYGFSHGIDARLAHTTSTRMHSSRMHTIHCSGCLSCHAPPPPPIHAPAMHALLHHTCHLTMHTLLHHTCPLCHTCPPPLHACPPSPHMSPAPCGQTDACENITFPQLLLWSVKMAIANAKIQRINVTGFSCSFLICSIGNLSYPKLVGNSIQK